MANNYFALLNSDNEVIHVAVVDESNSANEAAGQAFCRNHYTGIYDTNLIWKQAWIEHDSYPRINYPAKDYTYDSARDAFIPPNPSQDTLTTQERAAMDDAAYARWQANVNQNWVLNTDTCRWEVQ